MLFRRRGVRFALSAALACAGIAVLPGPSAWADLDIAYRSKTGLVNEGTQASATASCPAGMQVSGGGGEAAGGYGGAGLNTTYPGGDESWTTYYDSNGGTVVIRSHAVCIDRDPAIRTDSAESSTDVDDAEVRCPSAQRPTGGGVFSSGLFGQTAIKVIFPFGQNDTSSTPRNVRWWLSRLSNVSNPYANAIPFSAYAVCHGGLEVHYRQTEELGRKSGRSSVTAHCHKGERVLGGGGLAASLKFYVEASFPIDSKRDTDELPDDGWRVMLDNFEPYREIILARAACVEV